MDLGDKSDNAGSVPDLPNVLPYQPYTSGEIKIIGSGVTSLTATSSKSTVLGTGKPDSSSLTWPSNEEFGGFYESTTSVGKHSIIWKSDRKHNEIPNIVTRQLLAKHKTKVNAWMALYGKVFDVSGFIDRHPGGLATIEQGIGKDATDLFRKAHPNVNYETILRRDFVGLYMPKVLTHVKKRKGSEWCCGFGQLLSCCKKKSVETTFDLKFTENEDYVVLFISATPPGDLIFSRDSWTVILWDRRYILVKTVLAPPTCWVCEYYLKDTITYEFVYVGFKDDFKSISILVKKPAKKTWNTIGEPYLESNCSVIRADQIEDESLSLIFYRQNLTPNVILVGFKIRPSSFLGIPIGYSIRLTINGVSNWLTPVVFSLLNQPEPRCSIRGESIYFMVKVTPDSILSGIVNNIPINTQSTVQEEPAPYITMGCTLGTFNMTFLEDVTLDGVVLFAHGTGIIPMIRIIQYYLDKDPGSLRDKYLILLYYNKKPLDIIWRDELKILADQNSWLSVFFAVEEPDKAWKELQGPVSVHLVKWCLESISGVTPELRMHALSSGDEAFNTATDRLFTIMKDYFDKTFTFPDVYG